MPKSSGPETGNNPDGQRLKQAIHVARARANILYDTELAEQAGVSYDTLMNWYGGKTVPRGAELRRVAQALGVKYSDLMAAYEGADPEAPELTEALRELITEVHELIAVLKEEPQDPAQRLLDAVAEAQRTLAALRYDGPGSAG